MGMVMNVIEDVHVFCLGLDYKPSVCVIVVSVPGRRLGVEITTHYSVWKGGDML